MLTAAGMVGSTLDLARPPMLLYVERDGVWKLAGVEYALTALPRPNPLPAPSGIDTKPPATIETIEEVPAPRAADCPTKHPESSEPFVLWHPAFAVVHVWAWIPSPDGPFSGRTAALAPYGGAPAPSGHRHPRSEPELAYSQVTHRVAGGVLILVAVLTAWEAWRPRRFPWSALSSVVFILFGLYLIPTSDPESWPWGPGTFMEIFTDPLVLQHKLLALVPLSFGVIGGPAQRRRAGAIVLVRRGADPGGARRASRSSCTSTMAAFTWTRSTCSTRRWG